MMFQIKQKSMLIVHRGFVFVVCCMYLHFVFVIFNVYSELMHIKENLKSHEVENHF